LISLNSVRADIASYSYLGTVSKDHRAPLASAHPKTLLADENVSQVIVLPTMQWKLSSAGPAGNISRYKREFLESAAFEEVPDQVSAEVDQLKTFHSRPTPNEMIPLVKMIPLVNWSDIYFLLKNGDFVTFGEDSEWLYFRSHSLLGRFKRATH
jgi:hypothetical protein